MTMIHNIPRGSMGHRDKTAKLAYFSIYNFLYLVLTLNRCPLNHLSTAPEGWYSEKELYSTALIILGINYSYSKRLQLQH